VSAEDASSTAKATRSSWPGGGGAMRVAVMTRIVCTVAEEAQAVTRSRLGRVVSRGRARHVRAAAGHGWPSWQPAETLVGAAVPRFGREPGRRGLVSPASRRADGFPHLLRDGQRYRGPFVSRVDPGKGRIAGEFRANRLTARWNQ
jgi:hypothetical protein